MVREEAVLDRRFWFTVTPAADGRKCPAQALGQVMEGGGGQEVALGCDSARRAALNICPFCCACIF